MSNNTSVGIHKHVDPARTTAAFPTTVPRSSTSTHSAAGQVVKSACVPPAGGTTVKFNECATTLAANPHALDGIANARELPPACLRPGTE